MNDKKDHDQEKLVKAPPPNNASENSKTTVLKIDHEKKVAKGDLKFKKFAATVLVGSSILLVLIAGIIILIVFLNGNKHGKNPVDNKITVRAELSSENGNKSMFFDDHLETKWRSLGDAILKQINPDYNNRYHNPAFITKDDPPLGLFIEQIYNIHTSRYVAPSHGGYFELTINGKPSPTGVSSTLIRNNYIFDFILQS